jgi:hypothetical protein
VMKYGRREERGREKGKEKRCRVDGVGESS